MEEHNKYQVLLYYNYTKLNDAEEFAVKHLKFCKALGIKGRIIVAEEGLNGTVSGTSEQCQAYMAEIRSDERLKDTEFKVDWSETHAFQKMHVRYKPEIVHLGLRNGNDVDPTVQTGKHLEPKDLEKLIANDPNVVLVDMRSNYEHSVGRFKNAITLDIENFREVPENLDKLERLKGKTIVTYCTGGIKCEKASALLLREGFEDVYQLHGGIIKYGQETDGSLFDGKCYVFDNRLTVDINHVNPTIISRCYICSKPSDRMINCANPECNEHEAICEECGWEYEGACSTECKEHPRKREYDGTGYYVKTGGEEPVHKQKSEA